MQWTRELIGPEGILILHLYGKRPNIVLENFAYLVVNMEELSGHPDLLFRAEDVPVVTVLAESIPRSPCPSYSRNDRELKIRNLIAQLVVLGMFHWVGGTDPLVGITLDHFRRFSRYSLPEYRFRNGFSGIIRVSQPDVRGAVYHKADHAIVVLSNTGRHDRKEVRWQLDPSDLDWSGDVVQVWSPDDGAAESVSAAELREVGRVVDLGPLEYRLVELRPG